MSSYTVKMSAKILFSDNFISVVANSKTSLIIIIVHMMYLIFLQDLAPPN